MAPTATGVRGGGRVGLTKAEQKAHQGSRDAREASASRPVRALARVGLASRAVVYLILGYLAVDIAVGGGRGKNASSQGALAVVAHQTAGPVLVVFLAAGFCAYAVWRFLQAAAGDPGEERGTELAKRLGWAAIGVVYVALAVRAALLLAGHPSSSNSAFSASKTLLDVGGPPLLAVVGLGVVAGGIGLAVWALAHDFGRQLDHRRMPQALTGPAKLVEVFGTVIRGLVFAAIGSSLVVAAVSKSAKQAKGLNGAVHSLAGQPYGVALLGIAAAGLLAFGLASVVEALYRKVTAEQRT
jgi:Domain of Unknown Function (DUF1206)